MITELGSVPKQPHEYALEYINLSPNHQPQKEGIGFPLVYPHDVRSRSYTCNTFTIS